MHAPLVKAAFLARLARQADVTSGPAPLGSLVFGADPDDVS